MPAVTYWLDLFTPETWDEFTRAGGKVSGFRERRWKTVQQMKPGDVLLCYLTGISRFVGALEVTGKAFQDSSPIWKDDAFPARVPVKIIHRLSPETAVPVHALRDHLSIFENLKSPFAWTGHFRGSPAKWKQADGEAVVAAVADAVRAPVIRPVDKAKLAYRPKAFKARIGTVTVPDEEEDNLEQSKEPTAHQEMQWLLLKLGNDMGLDVWVARNDRGRSVGGKKFESLPRLREELPVQFDEATTKTIELIDVLWLKGNAIVAAFEIESTTSIYSGLLRMADLVAMQPNLNIPLFLVAPEERRAKVIAEVNRPTFSRLTPPLNEMCRLITFTSLKERVQQLGAVVRYLKPDFLEDLSETCAVEGE